MSVISQAFLISFKPYKEKAENYIEIFNEVLNSIYLYNLLSLTEAVTVQTVEVRNMQGWILVILCLITVLVNSCLLLRSKFYQVKNFIEVWKNKYRLAKKENYVINKRQNNNEDISNATYKGS